MLPSSGIGSRVWSMEAVAVGPERDVFQCRSLNDIRQYMSYKIVSCALMKHINKGAQINVPPSPSLDPCSGAMSVPQRLSPDRLPDPWLLDTEGLLSELARIRELALRIPPVRNDVIGPINSVVDAVWDLEGRLRYSLHLHCEAQRSFARRQCKNLPKSRISTAEPHASQRIIAASNPL